MIEKAKEVSEVLKLLANENRLVILCLLIEKERSVNEIYEALNESISLAAISQHLNLLKASRLVDSNKKGLYVYYHILDMKVVELIKAIKLYYC